MSYDSESILDPELREKIQRNFAWVINKLSLENRSNTPDYILADFLIDCLEAFERAARRRDRWWEHNG